MQRVPASDRELTDGWQAEVADDHLRRAYAEPAFDDRAWHPVDVPGHWRSSPAFATADGPLLHRCRFEAGAPAGARRAWLTFDGLFYQGDVWLDGGYLGDTEGYFVPHTFEVTDQLRDRTEHVAAVEVTCPPPGPASRRAITGAFHHGDHVDPAWNPGGIWRPVRLTETGPVRIATLRVVCTEAGPERAVLTLRAVLDSDGPRRVRLRTEVGALDHEADQPLASGTNEVNWTVTVDRPALWWPRVLGKAVLHDVRVAVVLTDDAAAGGERPGEAGSGPGDRPDRVSDERRLRTGLRSVRLRRWVASVNGERLFLKGTNLGPTRTALGEATPEELRRDIDLAVGAGLDLARVHAHVSRPELYDAADEQGLLLWQDLPLAGGMARGIRRQAARQARAMVDLLGHHPSVALWCGHDQPGARVDWPAAAAPPPATTPAGAGRPGAARPGTTAPEIALPGTTAPDTALPGTTLPGPAPPPSVPTGTASTVARSLARQQLPSWNRSVLDASVKRALHKADGSRPVVAHSGVAPHLPQLDGTDSHLSLGWHTGDERDLPGLARSLPRAVRFVSRFGAPAVPPGEGAAFARPERWPDLDWERLEAHHGLDRAGFDARVPPAAYASFAGWRDATQRYQAGLIRRHAEELRRLKYRPTGGFAQYLFADGRPGITWSVLDHDRRPKPGYEALRAACRPVIVVADRLPPAVAPGEPLALDVHVVSDLRVAVDGARVTARLSWPGGGHSWRWTGDLDPDTCVRVGTIQALVPAPGAAGGGVLALDLELVLPGRETVTNHDEARLG
jgi:beta-mannosidase